MKLIAANPKQVEQYRAGKKTMIGFFVGQVMKASKGQANPQLVNEVLTKKLEGVAPSMRSQLLRAPSILQTLIRVVVGDFRIVAQGLVIRGFQ